MPQGGKDENENYFDAAIRELQEETSIKNVTLIKEIDDFIYDYFQIICWDYMERKIQRSKTKMVYYEI